MTARFAPLLAFALLAASCTNASDISAADLPSYVLALPPKGMALDESSGERTLEQLTAGDPEKAQRYRDAGFRGAFQNVFVEIGAGSDQTSGLRLVSGAVLFSDAQVGLAAIRQTIADEGDAKELTPLGFAPTSYVAKGTLDLGLPPGYLFVWPHGDVLFFLSAVAFADIREPFLRGLAQRIEEGAP